MDRRYALGWTGRDLAVVTSLKWFGRRYHWDRRVSGRNVDIEGEFYQDIFDFKTNLNLQADGQWSTQDSGNIKRKCYRFSLKA